MTAANFKPSLTLTLAFEGGYVNNPKDPGGATNKGVTQAVYDAYRQVNNLPRKSVSELSLGEAAAIYRQQYWAGIQGDKLPLGVDYAVFDFAVNSGVARAVKTLQECLDVAADGHLGNITLAKLAGVNDLEFLIERLCMKRVDFMKSLSTFDTFGKGWLRRVEGLSTGAQPGADSGVVDYAAAMIAGNTLPLPKYIGALVGEPQTAKAA